MSEPSNHTNLVHSPQKSNNLLSGSTAVIDGYTFTSPSIYLAITGTAAVSDYCGQVGPKYTGLTLAIPSGGLSTLSYDVPVGSPIRDISAGFTKRLDPKDLHCPKWGVETPNGGLDGWKVGPPFMPIILAPPELQSLNTDWARCTYATDRQWIVSYGIFDPPRILTPAGPELIQSFAPIAPTIVTTFQTPKSTGREAEPASQISDSAAKATHSIYVDPFPTPLPDSNRPVPTTHVSIEPNPEKASNAAHTKQDPSKHGIVEKVFANIPSEIDPLDIDQPKPAKHDSYPANTNPNMERPQVIVPTNTNQKPNVGAHRPHITIDIGGVSYTAFEQVDPSQKAELGSGGDNTIFGGNGHTTIINIGGIEYSAVREDKPLQTAGATHTGKEIDVESNGPRTTENLGNIIMRAFGNHASNVKSSILTIGGSKITANPSGLIFDGTTVSRKDFPITIAGTPIMNDPSGIIIGSKRVTFAPADPIISKELIPLNHHTFLVSPNLHGPVTLDPIITIDGQRYTAINPSAIFINGNTKVTISGIVYSTDSAGKIVMENEKTVPALSEPLGTVPSIITYNGLRITQGSNHIIAGGSTLTPGESSITISGTPIRLSPSGVLIIGTHSITIPQITPPPTPASSIITYNGLTITQGPNHIISGGSTLTPGGSSITISGTPIHLNPSGVLIIGTHSITLPQITPAPTVLTFGALKITEKADRVLVAGLTLTPDNSAVVISGETISLGSEGVLVVGSSTVELNPETSTSTTSAQESSTVKLDQGLSTNAQGSSTTAENTNKENSGTQNELNLLNSYNLLLWILISVVIIPYIH